MSAGQPLQSTAAGRTPVVGSVKMRNLFIGGLLGALGMLLALPASRPFYFGILRPSPLDKSLAATAALAKGNRLPDTHSLDGQAMWFHVAAGRLLSNRPVSPQELATVERLMAGASIAEPQNAFWPQADAALLAQSGRLAEAKTAWIAASNRLTWNDHQNDFLGAAVEGRRGVPAYAFAELYQLRTDAGARLILQGAQQIVSDGWVGPKDTIPIRLATVLNGNLIRQRARSIASMRIGTEIIESAVTKSTADPAESQHHQKSLLIARSIFAHAVEEAKLGYDHTTISKIFDEVDAANALTTIDDVKGTMQSEAIEATVIHTAPGAVILSTLLGYGVLLACWALRRIIGLNPAQSWPRTAAAAALAVTVALFLTSVYAAFALGLCILFAGSTPANIRKRRPPEFGPLFWVLTSVVAFAMLLAFASGLALTTMPSHALIVPLLRPTFDGNAAACGVAVLAIGFLFLCAPLWAFAQRLPTMHILEVGLREVGQKLVIGSLLIAVISGPVCVYLDKLLVERRLVAQFRNEPLYYYLASNSSSPPPHDTDSRP